MSIKNRIHNASNPYQGSSRRVLCVCSAGLLRSPTAANVLHREFGYNTRAAGMDEDFALIVVDEVLLSWCEEVIVMSNRVAKQIRAMTDKPVINLDIMDSYDYMEADLQRQILTAYKLNMDD